MSDDRNNNDNTNDQGTAGEDDVGSQTEHRGFQGRLFPEPTFQQIVDWYRARVRNQQKARSRIKQEDGVLNQALEWLTMRGIKRPVTAHWKEYLEWRMDPTCSLSGGRGGRVTARTADSHRAILNMVYRGCRNIPNPEWHHVPNPVDAAVLPKCHSGNLDRPRAMMEPYVTYPLLQMAMPDLLAKAFISVMRWHGLRVQEVLGIPLPGGDVDRYLGGWLLDMNGGTLRIERQRDRDHALQHEPLKTEFSRARIKLAPEPLELLRAALTWRGQVVKAPGANPRKLNGDCARNYVFPYFRCNLDELMGRHRQVAPADFPTRVRGVEGGDAWHVYRHTFAKEHYKRVLDGTLTQAELHKMLRHANPATTSRYLTSFNLEVVGGSEAVEESWRIQARLQEQAIRERSGQGLTLVPERPSAGPRLVGPTPASSKRRATHAPAGEEG